MIKSYIFCVIISIIISFVPTIAQDCKTASNTNCTTCLDIKGCAYCKANKDCFVRSLNPLDPRCTASNLQMDTCITDTQTLYIVLGSVGGVVLLVIIIVICCLCRKCRQCSLRNLKKKEELHERELEERRSAAEVRSAERRAKDDQIRAKYNISRSNDNTAGYTRMG